MASKGYASDTVIRRMREELQEKSRAADAVLSMVRDADRDMNDIEREQLSGLRSRMEVIKSQLGEVEATAKLTGEIENSLDQFAQAAVMTRKKGEQTIEYRSAGGWALDSYKAALGDRESRERLEIYYRVAAHQTTPDNLGVIPDPVIGNVINFIDSARPLVSFLGPQPMPSATWHRPYVTQQPSVAPQGYDGSVESEKQELVSQKMIISKLTANAVTYGGYVNVSRQNIDFSSPQILDIIINGLAAQYAVQTEAAIAAELAATATVAVGYGGSPTAITVHAAIWSAVAKIYAATKGQGRIAIAVAPDVLGVFGPLFLPVNPQSAASPGMTAANFSQGVMGSIGGVPIIMSAGLDTGEAFAFSTAAIEAFEQRVGTLQVTEPSVLGVQVAYAGYFTPLTINDDAIVPLTAT